MDETILLPSPNWFQVSGLTVSKDGWIVYGGPSKSLCVLVPHPQDNDGVIRGSTTYQAHVLNRAHVEKIVSVDISPEWPEKRLVLAGSADGGVKQWNLDPLQENQKFKPTLSHDIHSHEKEEVAGVGYSTENYGVTVGCFGNIVKWDLKSNVVKTFNHLKNFKPVCMACSPHLSLNVAIGTKQGVVFVLDLNGDGKIVYKVRGQDDEIVNLSWCPKFEVALKKTLKESEKRALNAQKTKDTVESASEHLNESGIEKKLPEDSFDESAIVPDDDIFDIYKDHEADEFGHKKYQPEEIYVKVHVEKEQNDYLDECLKLKEEILKRKTQGESSMQSLVEALDKTHIKNTEENDNSVLTADDSKDQQRDVHLSDEASAHVHKHLLATISKYGGVRLWSKSGKLVGSCAVPNSGNKNQKIRTPVWPSVLWYKPDVLLMSDGKNQLLECNPLKLDCKNKLDWSVVHSLHKRSIYCIASNAPRLQQSGESEDWSVWTTSQDRNIIQYSLEKRKKISTHATCGGFLYTVAPCPYDACKVAVSVGDGAVRVWQTSTLEEDDTKLDAGNVTSYWQNVQGKVLVVAWHPTKENLLAFATAEARIGLIDTSGKAEKPARLLMSALSGGIYSLSWGEDDDLYACANGDLVVYHSLKSDEAPTPLNVELEGHKRSVSVARWQARGLACGTHCGAVALLAPPRPPHTHPLLACTHVFSKMIHTVEWHPQQTTNSSVESPHKNLIAVCSLDKNSNIVILEYCEKEDGSKQLQTWKTLSGHKMPVLQVMWNPHIDGLLLSTSQDYTVRVWDVSSGTCRSIFAGHAANTLGAAWSWHPALASHVLSGGGDCCLRLWDADRHPADSYREIKHEVIAKKAKKKDKKEKNKEKENRAKEENEDEEAPSSEVPQVQVAASLDSKLIGPKKFLLPSLRKMAAYHNKTLNTKLVKIMLKKYLEKNDPDRATTISVPDADDPNLDYLKIFGSINDVNEVLDKEMSLHQELNRTEQWAVLAVVRGRIDDMIQYASERDQLCPYLVSLTPCVSFKYWKDATQLYLAQIDRMVAKGEEEKISENKQYGGAVYRRVCLLLAAHDVRGAVTALTAAHLYTEAYLLCRIRYMDSIAEETLLQWATFCMETGSFIMAAICYIVLGNLSQAAISLGKLNDQDCLMLAAEIAKIAGHNMFADHVAEKRENIINSTENAKTEEILKELPSRIELLMKNVNNETNGEIDYSKNGVPVDNEETKE